MIAMLIAVCWACAWGMAQAPEATPATTPTTAPAAGASGATVLFDKLIWQGGPIVWFQLAVSVVGLAFAFERIINLRRASIVPEGLAQRADQLWRAGKPDEIEALCDREPSTLARMIKAIVQHRTDDPSDVATIAGEVGRPELKLHLQKAYPVITVATLEPMLGLFGTVWGMMGAFDTVAAAGEMGNPSILAADISVALITTAVGLAIAIPMLALYHFFKSRTNTYAIELDAVTGGLIKNWLRSRPSPQIARTEAQP
jgi:biopolymer transport protein ExbB